MAVTGLGVGSADGEEPTRAAEWWREKEVASKEQPSGKPWRVAARVIGRVVRRVAL